MQNLFNNHCQIDPAASDDEKKTLKVGQLNVKLDELVAAAGNIEEQGKILRWLMQASGFLCAGWDGLQGFA